MITENLKLAWEQARENIRRGKEIEGSRKKVELDKLLEVINTAIITNFHKQPYSSKNYDRDHRDYEELTRLELALYDSDYRDNDELTRLELARLLEKATEMNKSEASNRLRQQENRPPTAKEAFSTAREILRAFRKEFLSAKELIQKENKSPLEKQDEISKIEKALREIDTHLHTPKKSK